MTQSLEEPIKIGELDDGITVASDIFKPCPFCGEKTIFLTTGKDGCINCPCCLASIPNECNDHIELVACWNNRTDTTQQEHIKLLRDVAEVIATTELYCIETGIADVDMLLCVREAARKALTATDPTKQMKE